MRTHLYDHVDSNRIECKVNARVSLLEHWSFHTEHPCILSSHNPSFHALRSINITVAAGQAQPRDSSEGNHVSLVFNRETADLTCITLQSRLDIILVGKITAVSLVGMLGNHGTPSFSTTSPSLYIRTTPPPRHGNTSAFPSFSTFLVSSLESGYEAPP